MDTYAADLKELVTALDLKDAIHVGHSTGGGEVAHYVARADAGRVAKAVLIGAVTPTMLKTEANPGGLPMEVFDGFRARGRRRTARGFTWSWRVRRFMAWTGGGAKVMEGGFGTGGGRA